jgi:hypothetical protein
MQVYKGLIYCAGKGRLEITNLDGIKAAISLFMRKSAKTDLKKGQRFVSHRNAALICI